MKRVKATIEVLVDVEGWDEDYDRKHWNKAHKLDWIKEELQDLEILSNNLNQYKVISVKETKQKEFNY